MCHRVAAAAACSLALAGAANAATLIHAGRLIDGVSDAPRERQTDRRIAAINWNGSQHAPSSTS